MGCFHKAARGMLIYRCGEGTQEGGDSSKAPGNNYYYIVYWVIQNSPLAYEKKVLYCIIFTMLSEYLLFVVGVGGGGGVDSAYLI